MWWDEVKSDLAVYEPFVSPSYRDGHHDSYWEPGRAAGGASPPPTNLWADDAIRLPARGRHRRIGLRWRVGDRRFCRKRACRRRKNALVRSFNHPDHMWSGRRALSEVHSLALWRTAWLA